MSTTASHLNFRKENKKSPRRSPKPSPRSIKNNLSSLRFSPKPGGRRSFGDISTSDFPLPPSPPSPSSSSSSFRSSGLRQRSWTQDLLDVPLPQPQLPPIESHLQQSSSQPQPQRQQRRPSQPQPQPRPIQQQEQIQIQVTKSPPKLQQSVSPPQPQPSPPQQSSPQLQSTPQPSTPPSPSPSPPQQPQPQEHLQPPLQKHPRNQLQQLQKQPRNRHLRQKTSEGDKREIVEQKSKKTDPRLAKISIKLEKEIQQIQQMCERETDYARGEAQRREEETEIIMKEVGYQIHATAHEVVDIFMGEAKMKQTRCRPTLTEMSKEVNELVKKQRGICDDTGLVEECLLDFEEERRKNSTFMAIALLLLHSFIFTLFSVLFFVIPSFGNPKPKKEGQK